MATDPASENTYVFDSESAAEMARLINQDRLTTKGMGGVFAGLSQADIAALHTVLDIGCGPGGWVLDVAFEYPNIDIAGVDISKTMIEYAYARARTQKINNASFGVMDITQSLDFSDASIDMVNARLLFGVLRKDAWTSLIAECKRVLRPGGILRLAEPVDLGTTSSPAFERFTALFLQAMLRVGYGFSLDGRNLGLVHMLPRLLRDGGFQNINYAAHMIDFSSGTSIWMEYYRNIEVAYYHAQQLLIKAGVASQEEVETLYQQLLIEMHQESFCGMGHSVTVWGYKP